MNIMNGSAKKLWILLAGLALAIALAFAAVYLHPEITGKESGTKSSDSADDTTDTVSDESGSDSTDKSVSAPLKTTLTMTFLGETAPGSPYGTSAYGSLNALVEEKGTSYFFSEIADVLAEDDLTVLANSCVFFNNTDAECSAPVKNASVYADASVELVANLAPWLNNYTVQAAIHIQGTGVHVSKDSSVFPIGIENLNIKILTAYVTSENAADLIETVRETAATTEYLVLYFYGGEINSHVTEDWLSETMHACVDAGASLIVGCGTGVLRPIETYNGVTIAYSLGALIDGTQLVSENATALMRCTVSKNENGEIETDVTFLPCYVFTELWQPALMTDAADADLVTRFLAGEIPMPIDVPMPVEE